MFDMIKSTIGTNNIDRILAYYDEQFGYPLFVSLPNGPGEELFQILIQNLVQYSMLSFELEEHQAVWDSYDFMDGYEYIIEVSCFCTTNYITPKEIVVYNNTIKPTRDLLMGNETDLTHDSIPELFDRIERTIDRLDAEIIVSL